MQSLLSADFWRSMGGALTRTAMAGLAPFLPGLTSDPTATWPKAAATVGLLLIATIGTSLQGVPDPSSAGWGQLLTARGLRQFGQFLVGSVAGSALLADVDWTALLQQAGTSAASTVVLGALTLAPGATGAAGAVPAEPDDESDGFPPDYAYGYPAPAEFEEEVQ